MNCEVDFQNPPCEQMIEACVELLDTGRPLREVLNEIKCLCPEDLRVACDSAEQAAEQNSARAVTGEERSGEPHGITQIATDPVAASGKSRCIWSIAAVILLSAAAAIASMAYPPLIPIATVGTPAPTAASALSPIRSPADANPASGPARAPLTVMQNEALVNRGNTLLRRGNIAGARRAYEPAAESGYARAAIYLGATYDPYFLKRGLKSSLRGDAKMAKYWYQRAREFKQGRSFEREPQ